MASVETPLLRHRPVAGSAAKSTNSTKDAAASTQHQPEVFVPPTFTIKDLLGAIPKHCFERNGWISSLYLLGDIAMIAVLAFTASYFDTIFGKNGTIVDGTLGRIVRVVAWAAYMFAAGTVGTGIWIIAHECGHQSYSGSKTVNNTVGWIFHSLLLVPYHSWRISHARHHAATGSMERDEVFIPKTRTEFGYKTTENNDSNDDTVVNDVAHGKVETTFEKIDEILEDAPLWNFVWLVGQQTVGWPLYLIKNASGQDFGRWTNHFDPKSPIFDTRHFWQIIWSDIGLALVIAGLTMWGQARGTAEVVKFYLIPYLIVNHHLVMITYLQHTDPLVPRYRNEAWSFAVGALCTVDRPMYGPIGDYLLHGITTTHVAHHVSSRIAHWQAHEATAALKEFLGEYYLSSNENIYTTLWKNWLSCKYVEDTGAIVFLKDSYGKAARIAAYESDSGVDVKGDGGKSSDEESD